MLTIDTLREFGADTETGLKRCMGMTDFYLEMVAKGVNDTKIDELEAAIAEGDLDKAFELTHAMKGVYGNLSVTALFDPISEMTELLRSRTQMDYSDMMKNIRQKYDQLKALL